MSEITDNHELMQIFYEEAQDLIEEMRKDLSTLSEERGAEILRRLFRCAHTIKSSSGSVGFSDLEKVTQTLEKIFEAAKDERFAINAGVIPLLVESVEVCEKLLNREEVTCYEEMLEQLNSILHV